MARIAVIGSINMDLVVETDIIPNKGETVLGKHFFTSPGGKGANQAVAAARLGGDVTMFGSIGNDQNGATLKANLAAEKVDTSYVNIVDHIATGVAIIEICDNDNRIIVAPGANNETNIAYLEKVAQALVAFDVIVMQLEIPFESIVFITKYLEKYNKVIILNPAPAQEIPEEVLNGITYITPNEHEFPLVLQTSGTMEDALKQYPNKLLITRGEKGVTYFDGTEIVTVPSIKVDVIDTTGAGDTFTGAFSVAISEGMSIRDAIQFANIAGGLSTTKKGAQKGMPTREDVRQRGQL